MGRRSRKTPFLSALIEDELGMGSGGGSLEGRGRVKVHQRESFTGPYEDWRDTTSEGRESTSR